MDDRESALLTPTQRENLTGNFDELSESQRSRLRDRVSSVLREFATVWSGLPDEEREKLFRKASGGSLIHDSIKPEGEKRDEFFYSLVSLVAFLYSGQSDIGSSREDFEFLIETAIALAESDNGLDSAPTGDLVAGYWNSLSDVDVGVRIHVEKKPPLTKAKHRLRKNRELTDQEIAVLVRHGELSADDLDRLADYGDG